jgi:hypothetical protein
MKLDHVCRVGKGAQSAPLPTLRFTSSGTRCNSVEGIAGHGFALQQKWPAQVRVGSKPEPLVSTRTSAFASCGHAGRIAGAALCHLETHASQQTASVFDHLVPGQVSLLALLMLITNSDLARCRRRSTVTRRSVGDMWNDPMSLSLVRATAYVQSKSRRGYSL